MRISFVDKQTPTIQGLASTLAYCGHQVFMWDKSRKSVYDMFTEIQPDVTVILKNDIDNAIADASMEFNTKPVVLDMPGIFDPFVAYNPDPACNPVQFGGGKYQDKYASDILYFSYIDHGPMLDYVDVISLRDKVKFFGPKRIHYPQYLGNLSSFAEYANALASTKVFVDVDGYTLLNASLLGTMCIGFGLNPILYPEEIFKSFNTIEELDMLLDHKLNFNQKERREFAKNNTFFHRAEELLNQLGYNNEAKEVMLKWNQIESAF
jgi:hypothetical protein